MSLRYIEQNQSRQSQRESLINLWKVARALVSPNGITRDSNSLKRVRKAVSFSYPSFIYTLLNTEIISIFEKYLIPCRLFKVSLISSSGQQSFTETLLSTQQSIQSQRPPPSFFTNRIGEVTKEELSRINPFLRFSSSQLRNIQSSSQDIEQIFLNSSFLSEVRRIS